jgi:hypothetical protein
MKTEKADIDVLRRAREHVRKGTYILVKHAMERQEERGISLPDVLRVLEYGRHEKNIDIFDVKNQCWKHAIRGKTINGIDLRVIVAFQKEMVIITVIRM